MNSKLSKSSNKLPKLSKKNEKKVKNTIQMLIGKKTLEMKIKISKNVIDKLIEMKLKEEIKGKNGKNVRKIKLKLYETIETHNRMTKIYNNIVNNLQNKLKK